MVTVVVTEKLSSHGWDEKNMKENDKDKVDRKLIPKTR